MLASGAPGPSVWAGLGESSCRFSVARAEAASWPNCRRGCPARCLATAAGEQRTRRMTSMPDRGVRRRMRWGGGESSSTSSEICMGWWPMWPRRRRLVSRAGNAGGRRRRVTGRPPGRFPAPGGGEKGLRPDAGLALRWLRTSRRPGPCPPQGLRAGQQRPRPLAGERA